MSIKLPFWATVFTVLGMGVLCALGTWQLHRLAWKEDLLRRIDAAYQLDAARTRLDPDTEFGRGRVRGVYDRGHEILLGPRTHEGMPGFHVITPLILEDGSVLLVNRGWVPADLKAPQAARGRVRVAGMLRYPQARNLFTPPNDPEKNIWYALDMDGVARAGNFKALHPFVLYLETQVPAESGPYPLAAATRPQLMNNHRQYAVFWFAMAGVLAVIYVLRFRRQTLNYKTRHPGESRDP